MKKHIKILSIIIMLIIMAVIVVTGIFSKISMKDSFEKIDNLSISYMRPVIQNGIPDVEQGVYPLSNDSAKMEQIQQILEEYSYYRWNYEKWENNVTPENTTYSIIITDGTTVMYLFDGLNQLVIDDRMYKVDGKDSIADIMKEVMDIITK